MERVIVPIAPPADVFWVSILSTLSENPESSQPVIMIDPTTGMKIGTFDASTVKDEERVYLLIENISSQLHQGFTTNMDKFDMQKFGENAFLIPITSPIFFGPLG